MFSSSPSGAAAASATLNLVDLDLEEVPAAHLAAAAACTTLNLSENRLRAPGNLQPFSRVQTLVLDKNGLRGVGGFAPMPSVTALMVNNNEIPDIVAFLDDVARVFPALTFLACMRNPCSPPLACVSEDDVQAARRHRLYVAFRLPRLQFLDSSPVTAAERKEAAERGAYLAPRRPKAAPVSSSSLAAAERGSPGGGGAGGGAAAASPEAAPRKQPASFLGVGASSYDGRNSEGNRFITDKSL